MNSPLVSIVIPSYKPEFFEQTLRSALGQTYSNIQVLVSDNCPDDGIKKICDKYPTVIYQRSHLTRGDNVRTALFSGAGKYIKPLFDDDILHPFCIEFFVNALESRADLSFVFSASAIINQQNQTTRVRRRFEGNQLFSKAQFHDIVFSGPTNPVGEFSTVMFSREVLWKLGLDFDKIKYRKIGCLTDVVFFLNLVQHGQAMYLDKELSYFRRDQTYQSNSNPEYNPNFGYCFADYLSILMDYDQQGLYQLDYENLGNGYFNIATYLAEKFPMVKDVFKEFSDYVKEKYHVTIGFEEQKKLDIELVNQLKNNMSVMDAFTAGNTLIAQNQPEKAKKLYQQWLDLYPTANGRHVVYHALGLILAQQKDAGNAKIAFEQALQAMPSFHKSRYSLAQQLIKLNQITEAQETLRFLVAPSNNLVAENPALYNVAINLLAKI